MSLAIKQDKDYTKAERKVFAYLSLQGTQRVVGTASLKSIDYSADYDLMEYKEFDRSQDIYNHVLDLFREKFKTAYKSSDIWIIDFKCGVLAGGIPIRWKRLDIQRGFQIIEDNRINFIDCLQEESMIKMDVISLINGLFHEFSEIYLCSFGDFKTYNPITTNLKYIETALLKDIKYYTKEGNYFKALKRLFAYLRIGEKNNLLLNNLIKWFNSPVGELSSYKNDLELISTMIGQSFRPISKSHIVYNLNYIEEHINPSFKNVVKSILNEKTTDLIKKHTEEVEEILNKEIQTKTKMFISSNKKIYSYIKV